jgi:type I restriction enzyme, S subunit
MTPWPTVPLGSVLAHRKEFIQIDDSLVYKRCRVQLHAQGVVLRDEVPGMEIKTKAQQLCQSGDFLVAEIDAKVGGYGLVPASLEGAIVSSHYFLFSVDTTLLDLQFLRFYTKTANFQDQVTAQGSTNYAAIRPAHVLSYTISLPPISEQRRIAERLEAVEGGLAKATQLHRASIEASNLLLYSEAKAIRESLTKQGPVRRLSEVTTISSGGTPERSNPSFWQGGTIPWIKTGELIDGEITESEEKITATAVGNSGAKLFPPETVLIAMYGQGQTRGRTGVLKIPATTNQACAAILPKPEVFTTKYLQYWLRSLYYDMRQETRAGAQPNWNAGMIANIAFVTPPLAVQRQIVEGLDRVELHQRRLQKAQKDVNTEMNAVLASALSKAFSGKL